MRDPYCHGKRFTGSTTTFVVTHGRYTIAIKSVPCLKCTQCGKNHYTDEVMQGIKKIVTRAKKLDSGTCEVEYDVD